MKYGMTLRRRLWSGAWAVIVLSLLTPYVHAATEGYDYDAMGRLVRRIDSQNQATEYIYDAAGNLVQVESGNAVQVPLISSITPSIVRRNRIIKVSATGSGLTSVSVRGQDAGVQISNLVSVSNLVNFTLAVSNSVPLGDQQLIFESAAGVATSTLTVIPDTTYQILPQPIAMSPDNLARQFTLVASESSPVDTQITVSSQAPSIAKVITSNITIPANQTEATIQLAGVSNGTTLLLLNGSSFDKPYEALVSVAAGGANRIYFARSVGISKGVPWSTSTSNLNLSRMVGIAKGMPWSTSLSNHSISANVGIAKGVPWPVSSDAGPLIAPLVGIVKQ